MLKRYYVDVSALSNDEVSSLIKQFNKFAFDVFEKYSDNFSTIGLDVYLSDNYDFDKLFTLPTNCIVSQFG